MADAQARTERGVALFDEVDKCIESLNGESALVHLLRSGHAACGAGFPHEWPPGHYFVTTPNGERWVNCEPCALVWQAEQRTKYALNPQGGLDPGMVQAVEQHGGPALKGLVREMQRREAEASVALDRDPDCQTHCFAKCDRCGREGVDGHEVFYYPQLGAKGARQCTAGFGCSNASAAEHERLDDALAVVDRTVPGTGVEVREATSAEQLAAVRRVAEGLDAQGLAETASLLLRRPGLYLPILHPANLPLPPPTEYTVESPALKGLARDIDRQLGEGREVSFKAWAAVPVDPDALQRELDAAAARIEARLDAEVVAPLRSERADLIARVRKLEAELDAALERTADTACNADEAVQGVVAERDLWRRHARNAMERVRTLAPSQPRDAELDELLRLAALKNSYRSLGFDPGFAKLAALCIDVLPSQMRCVHRELITTEADDGHAHERLDIIAKRIDTLIYQLAPHVVTYENVAAVHVGAESGTRKTRSSAAARRQLEVCGMIRSAALRYGCEVQAMMPAVARTAMLGKGNTKGATKQQVRAAVERMLSLRKLPLDVSDAGALAITGYMRWRTNETVARAKATKRKRSK